VRRRHARLLGYVYAASGRRAEALRVAGTLRAQWAADAGDPGRAYSLAFALAQVHVGLGERERALDWLERGMDTGVFMLYVGIEPTFRPLQGSHASARCWGGSGWAAEASRRRRPLHGAR
jgi:hypothetical protein